MTRPDETRRPPALPGARLAVTLLLLTVLPWGPGVAASGASETPEPQAAPMVGTPPAPVSRFGAPPLPTPWLDEVRAQRRAWEERRQASREAFEARRRLTDPWGSAQRDAWKDEVEERRQARHRMMEQERERLGIVLPPTGDWPEPLDGQGAAPSSAPSSAIDSKPSQSQAPATGSVTPPPDAAALGIPYPAGAPPAAPFSPQDWDNPWYFRGY